MIALEAGDYRLELDPARGGSILRCDWRGQPLMRPVCGSSIFDVACFPLVPFSNRIANGIFAAHGRQVRLAPNFPGSDHPHTLHGFGWSSPWNVVVADARSCTIEHRHAAGEWPWSYVARQTVRLEAEGIVLGLSLRNGGDSAMPAGLGFHPYFPRDADTVYRGRHHGEWQTGADGLPLSLDSRATAIDWWAGAAVGQRAVDTVYAEREGDLIITWPSRGYALQLAPSPQLRHTVVYTPPNMDFFCIEPVSHRTDAVNAGEMAWLDPGAELTASLSMAARRLG